LPLMRVQAQALMERHRTRRSAFYLPPTDELETVLKDLIEVDPQNRRVHRARLAEVYWDRGDEAQFLALALKAFATDSPDNGPFDFQADPRAPRMAIARMLLLFEQRGDWKTVFQLIHEAVQKKFAGEEAVIHEPLLEYHSRRLLGAALAAPGGKGIRR
jgi:hypothetical protein